MVTQFVSTVSCQGTKERSWLLTLLNSYALCLDYYQWCMGARCVHSSHDALRGGSQLCTCQLCCPTFTDIVGIVLVHATRVVALVETTAGVNDVDHQYMTSCGFVKRIPLFKVASTNKLVNNVGKQYRVWFMVWRTKTCCCSIFMC